MGDYDKLHQERFRQQLYETLRRDNLPDIKPSDIRIEEGRALLTKRRLVSTAAAKETVLVLRNFLLDPELPDRLFSAQTLRTQRFPSF